MSKYFLTAIFLGAGLCLAGCNGAQSNPMASSTQFGDLVPLHGQKTINQEEPSSPFEIDVDGENDVNFADFTEGNPGYVKFKVRPLLTQIEDYTVQPIDMPKGAQFGRSDDDPNVWILSWTPSMGTVPPGRPFVRFPVEIQARVKKTGDPRLLNYVDDAKPFEITVTKTQEIPDIAGVTGFKTTMNEGDGFPFSVEVKDPTSGGVPPTLYRIPYDQGPSLENFKADGSVYVSPDPRRPLEKLANGDWKFNFVFDTKGRELPVPLTYGAKRNENASGVGVCFNLRVTSAYGNSSPETPLCTDVKYASQAPQIVWDDVNQVTRIHAGQAASLKFTVKSPNGLGEVNVENLSPGFASWAGSPQLNCSSAAADPATRTCTLDWTVPCAKTAKTAWHLDIKATNDVGGKVKTANDRHQIEVLTDGCSAPVKKATGGAK